MPKPTDTPETLDQIVARMHRKIRDQLTLISFWLFLIVVLLSVLVAKS